MKKIFAFACVAFASVMLTSCAVKSPVTGFAYTNVKDGMAVTSNAGSGKVGTAEAKSYLGVVAIGDASIQAAAKEAGITRIQHVDYETKSILGVYVTYKVIVYGE